MDKFLRKTAIIIFTTVIIISCKPGGNNPGYQYMPDMVKSVAFEPYSSNPNFSDSMSARIPVKGSIPKYMGVIGKENPYMPYHYLNTKEGYEQAGRELKNPIPLNETNLAEGKRLYGIYCAICHGVAGNADGQIVASGKFPPPPSYFTGNSTRMGKIIDMSEGKIYHTIMYGLNVMGSYCSQLDVEQRWKIVHYIKQMQNEYIKANSAKTDSTATAKK